MANTCYITNVSPFDATKEFTFNFRYSGGNQLYYVRVYVLDLSTNTNVYDEVIQTMKTSFTIPANTLKNGGNYSVKINVYDVKQVLQSISLPLSFKCLATPQFEFNNIKSGDTIRTSNYTFKLSYSQSDGELLQSFRLYLYDTNKVQRIMTEDIFNTNDENGMSYTMNSMEDNIKYYIRATGVTMNGIILDTGYVDFVCDYITPSAFFLVDLENQPESASILIRSNIIQMIGTSDKADIKYVNGEYIDVRDNAVHFDEGFFYDGDATFIGNGYGFVRDKEILQIKDVNGITASVEYRQGQYESTGGIEKAYMRFKIVNDLNTYSINSNFIDVPDSDDIIAYCILKIGNYFEIKIKNMSVEE